jgi:SAM-dependent methyltransferase
LESVFDPGTIAQLESIGVAPGWQCLEAGGGGGSVAAWLCQRAGSHGRVVATDLDTRFLDALDYSNLDVRRHDLVNEPLPRAAFDLVHARAVLVHLPDREKAFENLAAAVKPGGWLLLEELDYVSKVVDPGNDPQANDLFQRVRSAQSRAMAAGGIDAYFGRGLCSGMLRRGSPTWRPKGASLSWSVARRRQSSTA